MATGNSGRGRNRNPDRRAGREVERRLEEKRAQIERRVEEKVEQQRQRLAGKIDEKTQRLAEKIDQKARKVAGRVDRHGDAIDRIGPVALAAYDLWTRERPGRRQPRHTLAQIADAALHVADAEGVEGLSMRRLAAELNAGTMTLYHYVHTKDELMALLADRVMGELVLAPDDFPSGWRAGLTAIARRSRDALLAHPWVFDIAEDPTLGPNGVRHFDQSLQAVADLDVPLRTKLDILQTVDEYVFGFCLHARDDAAVARDGPAGAEMQRYVVELASTGDYPQIAALLEEHGAEAVWDEFRDQERDPARFDRNLGRILDGIERDLPAGAAPPPAGTPS